MTCEGVPLMITPSEAEELERLYCHFDRLSAEMELVLNRIRPLTDAGRSDLSPMGAKR